MSKKSLLTQYIKEKAVQIGFTACGISQVRFLRSEAIYLKNWLASEKHGEMKYMENHFEKRTNPALLVEGAKSVISVLMNYFPESSTLDKMAPKISKYAFGEDYHIILKNKLFELNSFIQLNVPEVSGRAFVDSAPVMDKVWAQQSGLGWIGKNTNLITKRGSFFFIGELIVDIELEYDQPSVNHCGTCQKCIDACPTDALTEPFKMDARKCISYLTIEQKTGIPENFQPLLNDWLYGCDICQNVCPWNKKAIPHTISAFTPQQNLTGMTPEKWEGITKQDFKQLTKKSAMGRVKYDKIKHTLDILKKSNSQPDHHNPK